MFFVIYNHLLLLGKLEKSLYFCAAKNKMNKQNKYKYYKYGK
jgi:hypothetical protein